MTKHGSNIRGYRSKHWKAEARIISLHQLGKVLKASVNGGQGRRDPRAYIWVEVFLVESAFEGDTLRVSFFHPSPPTSVSSPKLLRVTHKT